MEQSKFIYLVKDGAIKGMTQYGVLASMTIAQAICESAWGESGLSTQANNLFGIKAWGYPTVASFPTQEYINGEWITVDADFRKYDSWSESILDHTEFLVGNSRYANLIGITDYKEACELIQEDGYATAPEYTTTLIDIIEYNNLAQYDIVQETIIEEENEDMIYKDFTEAQKAMQAEFVVPEDNNVAPSGDNITPLKGYGWIETTADGRILTHISRCTYYGLSSDGTLTLTHLGQTRNL